MNVKVLDNTRGAELVRQSTTMATGTSMGTLPIDGDTHSIAPVSATRAETVTALNRQPPVPKSSVSGVPVLLPDTTHDMVGPRRTGVPPSIEPRTGEIVEDKTLTAYSIDAPESKASVVVLVSRILTATIAMR